MAIKKSELYSSLWASCDELRGGMDASQYKDYILVFLFLKYVSDKADHPDAQIDIPKGSSFQDLIELKGTPNIGDDINKKILAPIAEANGLKGVIDLADFNDEDKLGKGREMVDRLTNLVSIFQNKSLDFSSNRVGGDDILGDAYEYLMRNFATQSGKSKGQFYTPAEVSRILAKVIEMDKATSAAQSVYDPTCGSGSLLLKAADEAPAEITIYGQEMDNATTALAKMNMILHGNAAASQDIHQGNTLASPYFKVEENGVKRLKTFDYAVANPPFSTKSWSNGFDPVNDEFKRFQYGIPPAKNGDYAFLLHIITSLKSKGKGAVILPHGVLFRGNAEATIRKKLLTQGLIKGVIGLPANLFYGTGIPACIIVLDKENAISRKGVFMIDASKGFLKDGNKNRLRERDIHKIVSVFNQQIEVAKYSRLVPMEEISTNEFNLNIPRYIDSQEVEDIHDIQAHLSGGIPLRDVDALDAYWQVYPTLRESLFQPSDKKGGGVPLENYRQLSVTGADIKSTIFEHPEFVGFGKAVDKVFSKWKNKHRPTLMDLQLGAKPKQLIAYLSDDLLQTFAGLALIDKYDIYQHLMDYWATTMQDDVYQIAADGWVAEVYLIKDKKGKQKDWGCDLVPKSLVINRYFAEEQAAIEKLEAEVEDISRKREELIETHGGEDGLLEEVKNDKGKVAKAALPKRIKAIKPLAKTDEDAKAELEVLQQLLDWFAKEKTTNDAIKKATLELDMELFKAYKALRPEEIKTLVVDDKWLPTMAAAVQSEQDSISQRLTRRIKELADRYGTPLPTLDSKVDDLTEKVNAHLQKMGLVWK